MVPSVNPQQSEPDVIFTLEPYEEVERTIGVYEDIMTQPHLNLEYHPKQEGKVYASLVRLDGYGDYTLKYYFVNPTPQTYQVTIRATWPEDTNQNSSHQNNPPK